MKRQPELIPSAVEEIVRWTTPVIQFCRTATQDFEIRDQKVKAGEAFCLFYPSANRDEDQFERPYDFDVGRNPNYHQAFGHGVHFCLGANMARWELRAAFRALAPVLDRLELVGEPHRIGNLHLGAVRHQKVRLAA